MFQKITSYLSSHHAAVLATIVALQNAKILKGLSAAFANVVVALLT